MSIPTHSSSCVTKAYQTKCPDCENLVWFFKCNCGSKVYFDELTPPWPHHECRNRIIRESLEFIRISDRLTDSEIYKWIDRKAEEIDCNISEDVIEILDQELGRRKYKQTVLKVIDLNAYSSISGKIIEINKQVSFESRFKINKLSTINVAMAGDLLKYKWAELFIRENPDKYNVCNEFRVYLRSDLLVKSKIKIGDVILCSIRKINNSIHEVWELDSFKTY